MSRLVSAILVGLIHLAEHLNGRQTPCGRSDSAFQRMLGLRLQDQLLLGVQPEGPPGDPGTPILHYPMSLFLCLYAHFLDPVRLENTHGDIMSHRGFSTNPRSIFSLSRLPPFCVQMRASSTQLGFLPPASPPARCVGLLSSCLPEIAHVPPTSSGKPPQAAPRHEPNSAGT